VETIPSDLDHLPGWGIGAPIPAHGDRLTDRSGKAEEQQPSDHCNEDPEHPAYASSRIVVPGGLSLISDWFRGDLRRLLLAMVARELRRSKHRHHDDRCYGPQSREQPERQGEIVGTVG